MIGVDRLRIAAALAAATLCGGTSLLRADEPGQEPPRLEIKHVGRSDRVTVETRSAAKAPAKVVPFPEDEEQPQAAARPEAEKAPFRPRFKPPAARQAQHLETAPDENAVQLSPMPQPAAGNPAASAGRALVDEAYAKSKLAKVDTDYSEVIDLCRKGIDAGLKRNFEDHSRRLMGWAYNRRGEMRAAADQDKEALADFEAAVELNPDSWRATHNRAVSYAYLGRAKEAMADFNRTIKLHKNYANAYFNRGELRNTEGDIEGAVRDYTAAIELGPADPAMFNSRGHALCRMKRYGEALRDYAQALEIDPEDVGTLVHRGEAYADIGKYSEAASDYRQAVKIDPKLGRAYQSAAWMMATCPDEHYRNDRLAIEVARKAIALDGEDDFRYLETLAAAQANAGLFKEAKETQEKAIAAAPRNELVPAEKRMALYQRDLAYRDPPRQSFAPVGGEQQDSEVRQASATSKSPRRAPRPNPRRRNSPFDRQ
jgi:tetratricopeptide (TPR) repeat protein